MTTGSPIKMLGAVATPSKIVRHMVYVLIEYWGKFREPKSKELYVLDPAVGDGRFLIDFSRKFNEQAKEKDWEVVLRCYGVDINPQAIEAASKNIQAKKGQTELTINLAEGNALLGFISAPKGWKKTWSNIKLTNNLMTSLRLEEGDIGKVYHTFHLFIEWPEIEANGGFDIIIGNPPYGISYSSEEKKLYRELYEAIDPEIESYILFIERSIHLLREGGLIGFVIPSNLLTNFRYKNIRKFLLDNVKILKIIILDQKIFPGFHVETCILFLQRISLQKERLGHKIQYERVIDAVNPFLHPLQGQIDIQKRILENSNLLLVPSQSIKIKEILNKMEKESIPLGEMVLISRGIELGFNSPYTSKMKIGVDSVPLIAGRSIRKFRIDEKNRFIRFNHDNRSIFKDYNQYLESKLMLRRIGHDLIAAFDPDKLFCVCDVYMIRLKSDRSSSELIYLEALINSPLMSFYLKRRFTSVKQIFPKIPIKYLKNLPIQIPLDLTKIIKLVDTLHNLPWNIEEASSHQVKLLSDLNQEIYSVYDITKQEQDIIQKSFNYNLFEKIEND